MRRKMPNRSMQRRPRHLERMPAQPVHPRRRKPGPRRRRPMVCLRVLPAALQSPVDSLLPRRPRPRVRAPEDGGGEAAVEQVRGRHVELVLGPGGVDVGVVGLADRAVHGGADDGALELGPAGGLGGRRLAGWRRRRRWWWWCRTGKGRCQREEQDP